MFVIGFVGSLLFGGLPGNQWGYRQEIEKVTLLWVFGTIILGGGMEVKMQENMLLIPNMCNL